MKQLQEIEVWYILPAIRREIAKELMNLGLKQKEVANILDITEPAVSQYFKSKRAKDVKFDNSIKNKIKEATKRIYQNPASLFKEIQEFREIKEIRETRDLKGIREIKEFKVTKESLESREIRAIKDFKSLAKR